ncbi:TPA: exonuclease [Candidatus Woesearchaeota archaeon]|nr:exonuclease [Candidatus Woesearchaeota archaeon]
MLSALYFWSDALHPPLMSCLMAHGHWTSAGRILLSGSSAGQAMITKSFIFLDGIGRQSEQGMWRQGISDWNSFLGAERVRGVSPARKGYYDRKLREARQALYGMDASYFARMMPQPETWRLYGFFREEAVFLDIETTGMGMQDDITVVGLFDGVNTKTMVKGVNLDYRALAKELGKYKIIVTFNGGTFDIPFIGKRYPKLLPTIPHIDLRTLTGRLGYRGGLKQIEKEFGISRREMVGRLHGGDAALLWRMFRGSGDEHYLKLLVEYNEEDVINLKKIADVCTGEMERRMMALAN